MNPIVVSFSRTVIHKLNATVAVFNQVREEASGEKGRKRTLVQWSIPVIPAF